MLDRLLNLETLRNVNEKGDYLEYETIILFASSHQLQ